jgi:hypothetical protein
MGYLDYNLNDYPIAGLLGQLSEDKDQAWRQALMQAGLSAMGGNNWRSMLADGLGGYVQGQAAGQANRQAQYKNILEMQTKEAGLRKTGLESRGLEFDLQKKQRDVADAQQQSDFWGDLSSPSAPNMAAFKLGTNNLRPTAEGAAMIAADPRTSRDYAIAQLTDPRAMAKFAQAGGDIAKFVSGSDAMARPREMKPGMFYTDPATGQTNATPDLQRGTGYAGGKVFNLAGSLEAEAQRAAQTAQINAQADVWRNTKNKAFEDTLSFQQTNVAGVPTLLPSPEARALALGAQPQQGNPFANMSDEQLAQALDGLGGRVQFNIKPQRQGQPVQRPVGIQGITADQQAQNTELAKYDAKNFTDAQDHAGELNSTAWQTQKILADLKSGQIDPSKTQEFRQKFSEYLDGFKLLSPEKKAQLGTAQQASKWLGTEVLDASRRVAGSTSDKDMAEFKRLSASLSDEKGALELHLKTKLAQNDQAQEKAAHYQKAREDGKLSSAAKDWRAQGGSKSLWESQHLREYLPQTKLPDGRIVYKLPTGKNYIPD